jgi:hypothetical protein
MQILTLTNDQSFGHLLSMEDKSKLVDALSVAKQNLQPVDSQIVIYETPEDFLE